MFKFVTVPTKPIWHIQYGNLSDHCMHTILSAVDEKEARGILDHMNTVGKFADNLYDEIRVFKETMYGKYVPLQLSPIEGPRHPDLPVSRWPQSYKDALAAYEDEQRLRTKIKNDHFKQWWDTHAVIPIRKMIADGEAKCPGAEEMLKFIEREGFTPTFTLEQGTYVF